jgi:hypothetical protein
LIDRKPAVVPGEHLGGGRGVEQPLHAEPPDHAAAHPLGARGQIGLGDWSGWDERRRCVTPCLGSSRHKDAVCHAGVEVDMMVERRTEALQEGDGAESRAGCRSALTGLSGPHTAGTIRRVILTWHV